MKKQIKILMFILILIIAIFTKFYVSSWNDASRMATIESLVEEKTFVIDNSTFNWTGDKVFINSHFYSDKPPMLSLIGAGVYLPLHSLGIELADGKNFAYYIITILTMGVGWLLCLLCFYLALGFTKIKEKYKILLTLSLAIGTLFFTWSTVFNNHSIAASLLFIGFYFMLKAKQLKNKKINLFWSGFFFSLAGTIDLPTSIFFVGFLLYVIFEKELRKNVIFFCIPLLLTVLPALIINFMIAGDFMPIQLHQEFFEYPGSPWQGGGGLSGITLNKGFFLVKYAFNSLIGNHGFFLYNPLLFLSIFFISLEIIQKRKFWKEASIIAGASIIIIIYYLLTTTNYGGFSYSIRWFVPLIPLLFFFTFPFFEKMSKKKRTIFIILLSVSIIIALIGIINPWSDMSIDRTPLIANLKQLINLKNYIYLG